MIDALVEQMTMMQKWLLKGKNERVRDARWIVRTHLFHPDEYICSACGNASSKPYKACPECRTSLNRTKTASSWVDEAEMLSAAFDDDY